MKPDELKNKIWWEYLHHDLKELVQESLLLLERVASWKEEFHDYSFVVFPAAKAYEGFLKNLFLDLNFITKEDYFGRHFRVGKVLNPSLDKETREREGVYDKVVNYCGGKELADSLWETWRSCRNLLFHYFPDEKNAISYDEAKNSIFLVINTMDKAFRECKIKSKNVAQSS